MSIVEPFKASYYNTDKVGNIKEVVCPPYDVINKKYEQELKERSDYNYVHMTLKKADDSYEDLSKIFENWFADGIFETEEKPCFYLLQQEFEIKGRTYKRRGLFAQLKLTGDHAICAHERTHEGPKEDRMNMLKFMKANLSPNFIIYSAKEGEPSRIMLNKYSSVDPFFVVYDENEKVDYKLWKIDSEADIAIIENYFIDNDLMIADGHHRTEVATKFFLDHKKDDQNYNYMMTYLSPVDDNLVVFPTHRILTRKLDINELLNKVSELFHIEQASSIEKMAAMVATKDEYAFGYAQDKKYICCTLKDSKCLDEIFVAAEEKAYKAIDSFLLHNFVLAKLLGVTTKEGDLKYTIDEVEAEQIAEEENGCVFLMKSTSVEEVMKVSVSGFTMPQKTTYFFPKLLSGLLIRKHDKQ